MSVSIREANKTKAVRTSEARANIGLIGPSIDTINKLGRNVFFATGPVNLTTTTLIPYWPRANKVFGTLQSYWHRWFCVNTTRGRSATAKAARHDPRDKKFSAQELRQRERESERVRDATNLTVACERVCSRLVGLLNLRHGVSNFPVHIYGLRFLRN